MQPNIFDFDEESTEVGGELNKLFFNPEDYTDINSVVRFIAERKKIKGFKIADLAVNGEVIRDSFGSYLGSSHVGSNTLKEIFKTPLHFWAALHEPAVKRESSAFNLGTFCHLAFIEPNLFKRVIVEPSCSLTTTEGVTKMLDFWLKKCAGLKIGNNQDLIRFCQVLLIRRKINPDKIDGKRMLILELRKRSGFVSVDAKNAQIIKFISRHYHKYGGGIIPELLKGAIPECSFYGVDKQTGIKVKVRPDVLLLEENVGANLICSFKTSSAETLSKFAYDCAKFKYDLSEGMYMDVVEQVTGRKIKGVIMIMLQTVPPYLPAVLMWEPEYLQNGRNKFRDALDRVQSCFQSGDYPGFDAFAQYPEDMGIIPFKLPEWVLKQEIPLGQF